MSNNQNSEITIKALFLGIILSMILAGANAYLGLFAGMTVSASIPAAVISMGVLSLFKNSNIRENNIVQTAASAGESLAAGVIFTIPALVMLNYWNSFDYIEVAKIAAIGGLIGVLFTVPLRRALIINAKLKYPEGVATAEVLQAGDEAKKGKKDDGSGGLKMIGLSSLFGGIIKLFEAGFGAWKSSIAHAVPVAVTKSGNSLFGFGASLSPALISVGYIVGRNIGILVVGGGLISWLIAIPFYSAIIGPEGILKLFEANGETVPSDAYKIAEKIWDTKIRFLGVGAMVVGGVWSLIKLLKPLIEGIKASLAALKKHTSNEELPLEERDMPINYVGIALLALLVPVFLLYLGIFNNQLSPTVNSVNLAAENSTIVVEFTDSVAVYSTANGTGNLETSDFALSVSGGTATLASATPTAISKNGNTYTLSFNLSGTLDGSEVISVAPLANSIFDANGNKASTPVRYKLAIAALITIVMMIFGFLFSAVAAYMAGVVGSSNNPISGVTIATILFTSILLFALLGTGSGIGAASAIMVGAVVCCAAAIGGDNLQDLKAGQLVGATPWKQQVMQIVGTVSSAVVIGFVLNVLHTAYEIGSDKLPAPQATLMKSVADGVFSGNLPWTFVYIGGLIAVALILIDLRQEKLGSDFRVPVLAVAVGIYLPITLTVPIFIGGMINHFGKSASGSKASEKKGLLMSSGFITGEALMGILVAVPIFITRNKNWWPKISGIELLGPVLFLVMIFWLYKSVSKK